MSAFGHFVFTFDYVCQISVIRFRCHCAHRTLKLYHLTVDIFVGFVRTILRKLNKDGIFVISWQLLANRTLVWCWKTVEKFIEVFAKKNWRNWQLAVSWSLWCSFCFCLLIAAIRFWCHCTHRTLKWCRLTVEKFVRSVWHFCWKKYSVFNFLVTLGLHSLLFLKRIHTIFMQLHKKYSHMLKKQYRKFNSNRKKSIWENWKLPKMVNWSFWGYFWLYVRSETYDFDAIAQIGP